jgi:hypothetical protein
MGMSTIQFRLPPPMKPVIEPVSCQTFRRPSGTPESGAVACRRLVYHLSGSHVSRCVVSATAWSSHRAFALSQLGDRESPPPPFDFAGDRIEFVPRSADQLNEHLFRSRLRRRLLRLLNGTGGRRGT